MIPIIYTESVVINNMEIDSHYVATGIMTTNVFTNELFQCNNKCTHNRVSWFYKIVNTLVLFFFITDKWNLQ